VPAKEPLPVLDVIKSESRGRVLRPGTRSWDAQTITRVPMGHSVSVTPVQVHYAMSVIANKGRLMEPMLVNRILAPSITESEVGGEVREHTYLQYEPTVRCQTLKPQTAEQVALLLRAVCGSGDLGTAPEADIPNYEVAGKTGTTQKLIKGADGVWRYTDKEHVTSFSGFFPVREPRYVITVVIDNAKADGKGGGKVAGPVFRAVAEEIIAKLQVPPAVPREPEPSSGAPATTAFTPNAFR
jgi:cell division protein FtsI/penicillin-binding protein 2